MYICVCYAFNVCVTDWFTCFCCSRAIGIFLWQTFTRRSYTKDLTRGFIRLTIPVQQG